MYCIVSPDCRYPLGVIEVVKALFVWEFAEAVRLIAESQQKTMMGVDRERKAEPNKPRKIWEMKLCSSHINIALNILEKANTFEGLPMPCLAEISTHNYWVFKLEHSHVWQYCALRIALIS